jgi:YYY domain-containing protein
MTDSPILQPSENSTRHIATQDGLQRLIMDLLLVVILLVAAYLRFTGIEWGEYTYLHPDERFLVWVGTDIQPIGQTDTLGLPPTSTTPGYEWRQQYLPVMRDCSEWGGYFDAACSPLNPQNRSHYFYVYGTLPMFVTRYIVEWVYGHSGFAEMTDIGRGLSAMSDLLTVFLVFLVASELFNRKVGLLSAAFAAVQVLPIQQSHFFTMDTFTNMFGFLAFYAAARIVRTVHLPGVATAPQPDQAATEQTSHRATWLSEFVHHPYFWWSILFGAAFGAALASKLSIYPLAFLLPAAMLVHFFRVSLEERSAWFLRVFMYLVIGGAIAFLVFRIGQPYAFRGPGFFNILPNPAWVANIMEQRNQAAGDIDFPPSLQWARRSFWFSGENLTLWGLGLPLGILAWAGFLWAGWRLIKPLLRNIDQPLAALARWGQGAQEAHTLPGLFLVWAWTAGHFLWVSTAFNPTMRYQLPIYPTFAILAAWMIVFLHDHNVLARTRIGKRSRLGAWLAWILGAAVLTATIAWAFAFVSIYQRPITRVAASRWIYENIPGPINLLISSPSGVSNQIITMPYNYTIRKDVPFFASFTAKSSGFISEIHLPHLLDVSLGGATIGLSVGIYEQPDNDIALSNTQVNADPSPQGISVAQVLDTPVAATKGQWLYLALNPLSANHPVDLCGGDISLFLQTASDLLEVRLPPLTDCQVLYGVVLPFAVPEDGLITEIYFSRLAGETVSNIPATLTFKLQPVNAEALATEASMSGLFAPGPDGKGQAYTLQFDPPLTVSSGIAYQLIVNLDEGSGLVQFNGAAVANEGDWDDGLPLRLDGYDAFSGIFTAGLNFNMYTDENIEKRERFKSVLNKTEYIFISSNRQWGSLPRIPERFPMSTAYYRALLGCSPDQDLFWCYAVAEPGMFQGSLGFELVQVFQSNPTLFGFEVNDQFAEEAFHVYDHPKVLIFKKTSAYSPEQVSQVLDAVDLTAVVHLTPKKAASYPATLLLPETTLKTQQANGTWSELFNTQSLLNTSQPIGVAVWYLVILVLGLLTYPILRFALRGLPDRGYPLARTAGLLLLSWLVWFGGSKGIPFTKTSITAALFLIAVAGIALAYLQRAELQAEMRQRWRYFLTIEGLFLAFFVLFLIIRLANPDLWHPWKGGERPMDFSYFNAVLKSTSFPPYDPWYAGGYMNYYYYGFVYSGTLVKWLGLDPSFAFNLILPTMFSLTALGAFSGAWNLAAARKTHGENEGPGPARSDPPYFAGMSAAALMVLLGNLGTLRMVFRGYQILVDPSLAQEGASLIVRWRAAFEGFRRVLDGASLPFSPGDWYWYPSRVMPVGDNAITEFPLFTFLYSDPHAHLFAMSIALLALGWVLSWALSLPIVKDRPLLTSFAGLGALSANILLGGLAVGALFPTNTWDIPTYLALGLVAIGYSFWKLRGGWLPRLAGAATCMLAFVGSALFLFHPFTEWYGQAYGKVQFWEGPITPLASYFTHWGLFLFLIVSFLVIESLDWMRRTPASALNTIRWEIVWTMVAVLAAVIALLVIKVPVEQATGPFGRGITVAIIALPLAAWAGLLLLRSSDLSGRDPKRSVLFIIGTGLTITLFVEVAVLAGDIGRQNTVFKLYLQTWTLFAVIGGAIVYWIYTEIDTWLRKWDIAWQTGLILLVSAAALFPLTGGWHKMIDRMTPNAPRTLNAMDFMQYSRYNESGLDMDLSEDYRAIRWMQENVMGSPVIVEANSGNLYRWYSRYTVYTGLPGVVGWEWHQQQQRALNSPILVSNRLREIEMFYTTQDAELARQFLKRYNVRYIVLGQLERVTYSGPGLDKFAQMNGLLWRAVYLDGTTAIYEVIP